VADIIFLGTNGWYDSPTGATLCVLVSTDKADIFLDCGSGFFRAHRFIDGKKPVFIILSHLHCDHISGLHVLVRMPFTAGLTILVDKGARAKLQDFINHPFTFPFEDLPYPARLADLDIIGNDLPFEIRYLPLVHSDPCLGFRITVDGKTLAFCTDTGYCENAVKLADRSDLLITECSHVSGQEDSAWPHLNPESAARIAREAGAKKLFLTHFDAFRYASLEDRAAAERAARNIFSESYASYDLMKLHL